MDLDHRPARTAMGLWRIDLPGSADVCPPTAAQGTQNERSGPSFLDVSVTIADDATVGDLAHALATHAGYIDTAGELTLAVEGRQLDPHASAADGVPRSGTTVTLCRSVPEMVSRVPDAPVIVKDACGARRLRYGLNHLVAGTAIGVGHSVTVTTGGLGRLTVNGVEVRGNATLVDGDLLRLGEWTATLSVKGVLRPPTDRGPTRRVPVSRGIWEPHEAVPVELPHPPGRHRTPGFPWLTAIVPLAMAAGAWVTTRSLLMVAFMGFSFVYVIASGIESRWEARAADRFAVAEFRESLAEAADEVQSRRDAQHERDETHHPSVAEATAWVHPLSHRLWERAGSYPHPLAVRLGVSQSPPDDPVVRPALGRPDLRGSLDEVCTRNGPSERPLTVDLEATGGVAVVGDDVRSRELAGSLVAQLTVLNPPGELAVRMDVERHAWRWADWLPHITTPGDRTVWIHRRDPDPLVGGANRGPDSRHIDGPLIWISPDTVGLPESIRALVHFDNHGLATLQIDHGPPEEFGPEVLGSEALEVFARRLAGFSPGSGGGPGGDSTPAQVTLASLGLHPDSGQILDRWRSSPPGPGDNALAVPLGVVEGGGILVIDLVRDGPHALVAGTTGAGKSELLRTMLLGLATRYPPDRLNLFLVDYKGGAAFGPLAGLPHCVGLLTDLRCDGAGRTLTALRAELRRRETLLEHHGQSEVCNLDQAVRPASLLLVVDEFATPCLRGTGLPRGHAGRRPTGPEPGDPPRSRHPATRRGGQRRDPRQHLASDRSAVARRPRQHRRDRITARSRAPREQPGRALVRLDHHRLVTTQVAYSGSVPSAHPMIRVEDLHDAPAAEPRRAYVDDAPGTGGSEHPDELEALTAAIAEACEQAGSPDAHRPVPPPLPRDGHLRGAARRR
ncbi:MAG: FtsK/SpoIIIE domain-containing protein [Microthrixaceae bacterium]|nr:FtsK/SpoIIIE domain-containing protein [Microthrixaceae bacterium]